MKRLVGLALLASLLVGLPRSAHAQRGRGRGTVMTPYGPEYNPTQTPEWRQAGGNYEVWEQIMQQKMLAAQNKQMQQQYQAMLKQQQAQQKWLKDQAAKKAKGQPTDPAYTQMLAQEEQARKLVEAKAAAKAAKVAKRKEAQAKIAAKAAANKAASEGTDPAKKP